MASTETEYGRFLGYLREQNASQDVRRLANLIGANLGKLAEAGAGRRARSTRLAPLAFRLLAGTSPDIVAQVSAAQGQANIPRNHQLTVGPFRGFMRSEVFDLSHDITLVYGANGTGKSSFCEALETALLGYIGEAQAKRVQHSDYCNNVHLRRHEVPVVTTRAADGTLCRLVANETEYRFCFLEKNRLDDFARIAARTPGDQRQLIATLFGIDQFSEFVRGFNQSLDESLQLIGPKSIELKLARNRLVASEQTVKGYQERVHEHRKHESALAEVIHPGHDYQAACAWLLGSADLPGHLAKIQALLDAASPTVIGFTTARLTALLAARESTMEQWSDASRKLASRAGEVSYSQLYGAVLALEEGADSCPACRTPLAHVHKDPFERARTGLQDLAELAALQRHESSYRATMNEALRALWIEMVGVVSALGTLCPEEFDTALLPVLPDVQTEDFLSYWVVGEETAWNRLLKLVSIIEEQDIESRRILEERKQLISERNLLDEHRLSVERLRTKGAAIDSEYEDALSTIRKFDLANKELIAEVESEKEVTALNERVKAAYDEYLPLLQGYLAALPAQLIQGLADNAKDLYNAFNRNDHDCDKLNALWLPVVENGKIEIEYVSRPGIRHDALVVLSEGHIRCVGLAILLAKNIEQRCPVIIFDDVVNAIDDEHRDGIWRTFFEDGRLDGKQIILTSHAEEFLNRIQQEIGAARAGNVRRYKFLPHSGEHELRVDAEPPVKNYVLLARQALDVDEKRDALRHSRPAIESLTDRLWTWMGKRSDGRLELKLPGPRSPWELNNKCLKLRSALNKISAQNPNVVAAVVGLDRLIGVNGASIEWGYLNSGTHDAQRDHEFDRATVRTIVESVEALDSALAALSAA